MKPLWSIITQAKGLTGNALTPQTQHPFLQATLFHLPLRRMKDTVRGDDIPETQPTPPPRYADGLLNDTHLMFKHPPFLVDANKWCDNKVQTRDVHCALKPLHGSQRRTQIVASVSKVAWTRVRRMPSDQTRNHAWRVAH